MKIAYIVLMVITGMLIPVMAALHSAFALHIKSPSSAIVVFFTVALIVAYMFSFYAQGTKTLGIISNLNQIPRVYFLAGICVVIYITSVSIIGPKFGIGNSLICVLLGQMITMTLIDHFALFGMPNTQISVERLGGLVLMLIGMLLLLLPSTKS